MTKVDRLKVKHLDNLMLSRMEIHMYVGDRRLCGFLSIQTNVSEKLFCNKTCLSCLSMELLFWMCKCMTRYGRHCLVAARKCSAIQVLIPNYCGCWAMSRCLSQLVEETRCRRFMILNGVMKYNEDIIGWILLIKGNMWKTSEKTRKLDAFYCRNM